MKIQELISVNLSSLTDSKQRIYASMNTDNTVTVNIDMSKWLHEFYKQAELRIYDPINSRNFNINKKYLTFFPSNEHFISHFYYNDISIDCSSIYKDLWYIDDDYSLDNITCRDTFISRLERSIENRLNKLKELYLKVESLNEIPYMYPPICEIPPEPEKPKCQISSENYRNGSKMSYNGLYEWMKLTNKAKSNKNKTDTILYKNTADLTKRKDNKMIIEPGWTTSDNLDELLQQATESKSKTPYTFTRDPDLDNLIEKITGVLKQITLRNDLSEETYKIKSIPRDIDKLISVYLNMSTEDRKNKKQELQKAIEAMLKVAVDYYEMVKCESVSELNVELKFIEHKYK